MIVVITKGIIFIVHVQVIDEIAVRVW